MREGGKEGGRDGGSGRGGEKVFKRDETFECKRGEIGSRVNVSGRERT